MTDDPKLKFMGEVLFVISNANDLAKSIEKKMNDNPQEEYTLGAEELAIYASSLELTATLATNLFEENQTMIDRFMELLNKHGITAPNNL